VGLAEQWTDIADRLPSEWAEARLRLSLADPGQADTAATLLAPAGPSRSEGELRLLVTRGRQGVGSEGLRRLLRQLDDERIAGRLELLGTAAAEANPALQHASLAAAWDQVLATLPGDWSDLYAQIVLESSDQLPRAALLLAPVNPSALGVERGFRFRSARRSGYGVSPQMARRCLERLDREEIRGELELLHALSDTQHVSTQGPVWYLGGRAV
jgi:hypothetical protein